MGREAGISDKRSALVLFLFLFRYPHILITVPFENALTYVLCIVLHESSPFSHIFIALYGPLQVV